MREPMRGEVMNKFIVAKQLLEDGFGFVQPKYDGLRCVFKDGESKSRSMKTHPSKMLKAYAEHLHNESLLTDYFYWPDGEILSGLVAEDQYRVDFRASLSVRATDYEGDQTFVMFDDAHRNEHNIDYEDVNVLMEAVKQNNPDGIPDFIYNNHRIRTLLCPTFKVSSMEEIEAYEKAFLDKGAEGLIFRRRRSKYKYGKSTAKEGYLVKLKQWTDAEAEIIDYEVLQHNNNPAFTNEVGRQTRSSAKTSGLLVDGDMLGAFVCKWIGGATFNVSCGSMTHPARKLAWDDRESYIGKLCNFKYFETGGYDVPRSAVFKGIRDYLDMPPNYKPPHLLTKEELP